MNDDVLKKIKELIRTKKPLIGKDKFEIMVNTCVNGIREHLKDYKKFNALVESLIGDSSYHFRVDTFITAVRSDQGGDQPVKADRSDFEPYKRAFVYTSFRLSGEEPENQERIKWELDRYSSFLANNRLIDCKTPDSHIFKRHLTRSEYEEISSLRMSAGTGKLRPFTEVKYHDEEFELDSERTSEAVKPITESMNARFWYNEPEEEAVLEF